MSKNHVNLRTQMRQPVFAAFDENMDKHSLRKQGEADGKIFSYGSKFSLLDRINDFTRSDAVKRSGVKKMHLLTPTVVQEYLDDKAKAGCTQHTIDEYRSELNRIGKIIGVDLSCNRVYAERETDSRRGSKSTIDAEDLQKILDYAKKNPSGSGVCIMLEKEIGVRVGDMCYGIRIDADTLNIRCKNGKWLNRHITPQVREIINSASFQRLLIDDKFVPPKDNSVNKYLSRVERKLGLPEHSFHDIRRRIAQDKYDALRSSGLSRSECLRRVSVWLNHGENREQMMLQSYIANAW